MKPHPNFAGKMLRISTIQMNSAGSIPENLRRIRRMASRAARAGADAVLFPECATTGYGCDFSSLQPGEIRSSLAAIGEMAGSLGINLLVGSPMFAGRSLFNCLVVFDRTGRPIHVYAKCQLTESDRRWFTPGNSLSLFQIDGVWATSIICHERRYPELVRFPVMAGAQILFHPNAGMDTLAVSKTKRAGRDGITARAFENAIHYVFANTVGTQVGGKWSSGDSKIVAPDGRFLRLADNDSESVLTADLNPAEATRKYALDGLQHPKILARYWPGLLQEIRKTTAESDRRFLRGF